MTDVSDRRVLLKRHDGRSVAPRVGGEDLRLFDVKTTACDGLAMVAVEGDLDCATAPRLRSTLEALAAAGQIVLVDLRATDFMDCAGIGALVASHQRLRRLGGDLVLDSPSGPVLRVLEATGKLDVITVANGEQ